MATPVIIPRVGNSVESCIIGSWKKRVGDAVKKGEILLEIETDKTVFEIEAPAEGIVLTLFFAEGALVPVQVNVAVIGEKGEAFDAYKPAPATTTAIAAAPKITSSQIPKQSVPGNQERNVPVVQVPDTVLTVAVAAGISPRARAFLNKHHMTAKGILGSGPQGRILERDVKQAFYKIPHQTSLVVKMCADGWMLRGAGSGLNGWITRADLKPPGKRLSTIRSTIATHMRASLSNTAQYTLGLAARADGLLSLRKKIKVLAAEKRMTDITLNHMVMFACLRTLEELPAFNAELIDNCLYQYADVNLGFACDTPRGLLVPVIKQANRLTLSQLSRAVDRLSVQAQAGILEPDDLAGATFTITNLGSLGIEYFTPVLNAPQVAILGVCNIDLKPVRAGADVQWIEHIKLCLTVDHQAIDGAPAARFLGVLKEQIENFDSRIGDGTHV